MLSTAYAGHAAVLAREAVAAGATVVFACGGDGTVNEVANGLVGTGATLGIIRGGMGNVLAKELRVPKAPEQALWLLVDGEERRFDLGVAGDRFFLVLASVGFDAIVVNRVPPRSKRLLGSSAYILWGAIELLRHRAHRVRLRIDGEEHEVDLFWLVMGNTRSYGGVLDITYAAKADDGRLDAYVFAGKGPLWSLGTGLRVVLRRHDGARGVAFHRLQELSVETPGLRVQADGEDIGETPMTFSVLPQAVTVLLPRGRADHLLSESQATGAS